MKTFIENYLKILGILLPIQIILLAFINNIKTYINTSIIFQNSPKIRFVLKWIVDKDNSEVMNLIMGLILLVIVIIYRFRFFKKLTLKINNNIVNIKVGDLFTVVDSIKVIPANEYFDTEVDNGIIAPDTLHGIAIDKITMSKDQLDSAIEKSLSDLDVNFVSNDNRIRGKINKYPIGTTIDVGSNYVFTALSRFNENNRAFLSDKGEYLEFLTKLWRNLDDIKNNRNISIPFFGTGNLNLVNEEFTYQEMLYTILISLKVSKLKSSHDKKIDIILTKNLMNQINLYELKNRFNL